MIAFEPVTYRELWECVEIGFSDDPALLEKYQQYDTGFAETVARNMKNVWEAMDAGYNFKFFKIVMQGVPIGFTVLDRDSDILFSFGINRRFRNEMVTMAWFKQVCNFLTEHFTCLLWNQNIRAIRFLQKCGMTIARKDDLVTVLIL